MAVGGIITVRIATHGTDGRVIADRVRITRIDPTTPVWSETLSATSAVDVTTVTADRLADLFHLAVPVDNSQGPVNVTVDITGTLAGAGVDGTDAIAADQVSAIIPPANDAHGHDLDGNRTADWRWDLTWNAAGHLRRMQSTPSAVVAGAPDQRITFDYDSMGRRFSKTVEVRDSGTSSFIPHPSSLILHPFTSKTANGVICFAISALLRRKNVKMGRFYRVCRGCTFSLVLIF